MPIMIKFVDPGQMELSLSVITPLAIFTNHIGTYAI